VNCCIEDEARSSAEERADIETLSRYVLHSDLTGQPMLLNPTGYDSFELEYPDR
jgi:hypothetical protein